MVVGLTFQGLGKHNGTGSKIIVSLASGVSGLALGAAFGVQTGMGRLLELDGALGGELRTLEALRKQLRKRGSLGDETFSGAAVEAERERLSSKILNRFTLMTITDRGL